MKDHTSPIRPPAAANGDPSPAGSFLPPAHRGAPPGRPENRPSAGSPGGGRRRVRLPAESATSTVPRLEVLSKWAQAFLDEAKVPFKRVRWERTLEVCRAFLLLAFILICLDSSLKGPLAQAPPRACLPGCSPVPLARGTGVRTLVRLVRPLFLPQGARVAEGRLPTLFPPGWPEWRPGPFPLGLSRRRRGPYEDEVLGVWALMGEGNNGRVVYTPGPGVDGGLMEGPCSC